LGNIGRIKTEEINLRVLYCSENYSPHDHRFLSALSDTEHEIYWLRLEEGGRLQESRSLPDNIRSVVWRAAAEKTRWLDYFNLKYRFRESVDEIRPDIIHAGPVQRVALLPALANAHPLISMSWGFDLLQDARRDWVWAAATRLVLGKSDWFLSDCQTVRRIALSYGMPEERTTVFPWGVDLELFHPRGREDERRRFGFERDLVLVHTRSWEPRYGVDVMLEGFRLACQKAADMRLIMLGGGSQEKWVKAFIHKNGLDKRVHFYGYQENERLAAFYRAADAYVSASHIDGSSVALMEAMACGCPALVSDIPSNLEWVEHNRQGWVFRDGDARNLAEKLVSLSRSRDSVVEAGKKARAKTENDADWSKNVQTLLMVYEKAAGGSGKKGKPGIRR
jgi:glycosyltransferase involved in cell wall biosynthesis